MFKPEADVGHLPWQLPVPFTKAGTLSLQSAPIPVSLARQLVLGTPTCLLTVGMDHRPHVPGFYADSGDLNSSSNLLKLDRTCVPSASASQNGGVTSSGFFFLKI